MQLILWILFFNDPKPKVKERVRFSLHYCQTVESVEVQIMNPDLTIKDKHEELVCDCDIISEKWDAKTKRKIIECDRSKPDERLQESH